MVMIWEKIDSPSKKVLEAPAHDTKALLRVRAWEVEDSPYDLGYKVVRGWPRLPSGWRLGQVAGVAVDAEERYYVYHRGKEAPPLICFNREGKCLLSWGEDVYIRPHMAKCDENNNIWLIDDGGHVLYLYTPEGELLNTLGVKGVPGADQSHFNRPTDIAFGSRKEFYVSDGYGNRRVARFDKNLRFLDQWGSEGDGEGQFILPHAVTTDAKGLVYVADRNRWRVQIFSPKGRFLRQWTHIGKPFGIAYKDGNLYICDGTNARVTVVDTSGRVEGFFGTPGSEVGQLSTAHEIAVAKNGDILTAHLDGRVQLFSLA